jgi:3-hydroxyisobutyrate dehydrogenase-like beta-hydroxyacid dehydrogenase
MTTAGIVSPGAMGSAVGGALRRGGARVVVTVAGRSERTGRLARDAGRELVPSIADVVAAADVVLSIVPPDQAEAVAAELSEARLLADLNAVSPATARRISAEADGSISGPPPQQPGTTRIYLSGPRAPEVAALPFDGVDVVLVGDEVGAASAVKMSTASVYKGSIALLAQALRAADHYGVLGHVLSDLGELADGADRRIARSAAKADRYVGEMHEISAAQAAAGLDPALFEAMAEVWAGIARTPLGRIAPENAGSDLQEVLRQLRLVQRELPEGLEVRDADADEP